jgi:hypothetical protein
MKTYYFLLLLLNVLIGFSQTSVPPKKKMSEEKLARLIKKHSTWDSCFIVKAKGDTIYGRVDHRKDQSSIGEGYGSDNIIFFAHRNEK